jgi:hypothetical protein
MGRPWSVRKLLLKWRPTGAYPCEAFSLPQGRVEPVACPATSGFRCVRTFADDAIQTPGAAQPRSGILSHRRSQHVQSGDSASATPQPGKRGLSQAPRQLKFALMTYCCYPGACRGCCPDAACHGGEWCHAAVHVLPRTGPQGHAFLIIHAWCRPSVQPGGIPPYETHGLQSATMPAIRAGPPRGAACHRRA